jgi:hypothetical protein
MSTASNGHNLQGVDDTAHKALKLAEELKKKMDKSLMEGIVENGEKYTSAFFLIFSGVVVAAMLGTSTGRQYQLNAQLATDVQVWEIAIYMIVATVALGMYFWIAIGHMILGNYVTYYSLFISTIALALGIFMTLVAVRTRNLPH